MVVRAHDVHRGNVLWEHVSDVTSSWGTALVVADGGPYAVGQRYLGGAEDGCFIEALEPASGELRWSVALTNCLAVAATATADQVILAGRRGGHLLVSAFSTLDGAPAWQDTLPAASAEAVAAAGPFVAVGGWDLGPERHRRLLVRTYQVH
jgi:hypothetical protein